MTDFSDLFIFNDQDMVKDELDCVAKQNLELFEDSIKVAIVDLEKKYNDHCDEMYKASEELQTIRTAQIKEENKTLEREQECIDSIHQLSDKHQTHYIESYWFNQQLSSLAEMQIINLFKNIEINIKTLIKIAYPKVSHKELYRWDSLVQFFLSKSINVKKLEGYADIINLKDLNNSLKHSGVVSDNIKNIKEFEDFAEYNFVNLINFYERIKSIVPEFLSGLANEIKNDLFNFTDEKIIEIANEYKLRMNEDDLKSFIEKLNV